jgi:hypothetical protein
MMKAIDTGNHPMLRPDRLRREPLAFLPALIALAMAATSLPARSQTTLIALCSGGALPSPNDPDRAPDRAPDRECDPACHVGCTRPKKVSGRL